MCICSYSKSRAQHCTQWRGTGDWRATCERQIKLNGGQIRALLPEYLFCIRWGRFLFPCQSAGNKTESQPTTLPHFFDIVVFIWHSWIKAFLIFSHNKFIQQQQISYFVSADALVSRPFYNSDFHEPGFWGYPVPLVYNMGYSVQLVAGWLMVYL